MQQTVAIEGYGSRVGVLDRVRAWAQAEQGRFAPWLPVFMAAGVVLYFALTSEPPPWAGLGVCLAGVAALALGWRTGGVRMAAAALLAGGLGLFSAQWAAWRASPMPELPRKAAILTATVRAVDVLPDGRRLVLDSVRLGDSEALDRRIRVRMKRGDEQVVVAGDVVKVRAVVRPPPPPAYPGGWDMQLSSFFGGLAGGGTALNPVIVLEHHPPSGVAGWVQAFRDAVGRRVMAAVPGSPGAISATFLTGSTNAIPAADRAAFRDSGLAHLLAVAGLHIGIVMGLVFGATRLLLACWERSALHWPTKPIAAVTALMAGFLYMFMAGAHVPVMRSFAMACLVTLGLVVGRRAVSLRGWALAALALMLIAPQEVVGVSFQMSFAAVLALISGYEALRPVLARLYGHGWWRRTASHALALVLTSLLAGSASAPYGAFHFGHMQLYFIAANVVAVPLTAMWVLPAGLIGLALMPFGLEWLALVPMGWGVQAILWIGREVSSWPSATIAVPPMPGWGLVVFSLGLAWLCLWRTRWRLAGLAPILLGLVSPLMTPLPDVLVSDDARLIAIRAEGSYWVQKHHGGSKFTLEEWEQHFASGSMRPIATGSPKVCDAEACRVGPILMMRATARPADCAGASLLVSAEPMRGECPNGVGLLDRFTVWRNAAYAGWIEGDRVRLVSDRSARGDRPWVPGIPTPRRNTPNLPMAPTESLPDMPESSVE